MLNYKIELSTEQKKLKHEYYLKEVREKEKKINNDLKKGFGWDKEDIYV